MKRIVSFSIVGLFSLLLVACSGGEVKTTHPANNPAPPKVETGPATSSKSVVAIPEAIALSKLNVTFTPKPECDGGECYNIEFHVSFKFAGDKKIHNTHLRFASFEYEVGTAKMATGVVNGKRLYATLSAIDPEKVSVTLVDDKVAKITKVEEWQGKTLIPEEVLWEERNW